VRLCRNATDSARSSTFNCRRGVGVAGDRLQDHRLDVLEGFTQPVYSLAFSPHADAELLISGHGDSTMRLWQIANPANPAPVGPPLTSHMGSVSAVDFAIDGDSIVLVSSSYFSARIWDLSDIVYLHRHPLPDACGIVGRPVSREEWSRFVPDLPYEPTC
jgi:WD40 repeat protein